MKSLFVFFTFAFCLFTFQFTKAQNIGIGTNTPNQSAALDVTSTNSGLLPPRMTLAQRNAIANPATGLIVFCKNCGSNGEMQFYNGNAWVVMSIMSGTSAGQMLYWNGSSWLNVNPGGYGQSLVFCDSVPSWGGCLPKVTTNSPNTITYTSATSGGNVTAEGGQPVTERGICWGTSTNPTTALSTKTIDGAGTGTFTSDITNLSAGTTYYVRAYATNSVGTAYGTQQSFTTSPLTVPTVTTEIPSAVSYTTATCGGNITSGGGATVTSRGVCWSTNTNPTIALSTKTVDGSGEGAFTSSITGLIHNKMYFVRAYATNSVGTAYGPQQIFITLDSSLPIVVTTPISNIRLMSAQSGGSITTDGGISLIAKGICWSTSPNPTIALSTKTVISGSNSGSYITSVKALLPNTTYYVRSYATNNMGTAYGSEISFTTLAVTSVTIGTQIWSNTNLSEPLYRNGDSIPKVTDMTQWANLTTGAWCWYNNDSATYAATHGRLYNWYAINDPRGLVPQGWHVPSDAEWNILTKFVDVNADTTQCCSNVAAPALKKTSGWTCCGSATNSTGFSASPGGSRTNAGTFVNSPSTGYWWTNTIHSAENAKYRSMSYNVTYVYPNYTNMKYGNSVRMIKD